MAGLLDYVFNPSTYSGEGGLLSRLSPMLNPVQPSAGFPQDQQATPIQVGNYQMPRVGNPDQFQPQQVMTPPNAQPTQGQMQEPSFGDRLSAGAQTLFGNPGGGLIPNLLNGISAFSTGQSTGNQTARFLTSKGIDPALAKTIVSDPGLLRAVLPQLIGAGGQTDDIKEYNFAKQEDPTLTFEKFMSRKRANNGEYGLNYVYGTDKSGNTVAFAPGKDGVPKQVQFPDGVSIARGIETIQTPTEVITRDKQSGVILSREKKDIVGAAKAKEVGEAEGQALVNLPTTIATAETALKTIKQLEEHPGKKNWGAFGVGAMLPDMPGTATRGFAALVDQVKGQNFMTAFQSLKGAGAITEQEGAKAEKAQARLDRAQSEADFDIALRDLKEVIAAGMERARQKAGVKSAAAPAASTPAPTAGGVQEGATATNPQTGQKITFRNGKWQ